MNHVTGGRVEFAGWLAAQREERHWTTRTLAAHSGVDVGTISRLENGRIQATLPTAILLADGLTVPLDDLYKALTGKAAPGLLTPLSADAAGSPKRADLLTFAHLEEFRTFVLTYPNRVDELLASMLTRVSQSLSAPDVRARLSDRGSGGLGSGIAPGGPPFHRNEIYRLLTSSPLYDAQLHYPPLGDEDILELYQTGGVILPVDAGAYLRQVRRRQKGTQGNLLAEHPRSASTLSRWEGGSAQVVKLSDALLFDQALSERGEVFGMFWTASRTTLSISGQHPGADDAWRVFAFSSPYAPYAAKLMNIFVTLSRWLSLVRGGDAGWLIELRQAMQNGENWGYDAAHR